MFVQLDFQDLFPDRDLSKDNFTIITLSQKTENDMTAWNETVEEERELLLKNVSRKSYFFRSRGRLFGFSLNDILLKLYSLFNITLH